MCVQAASCVNIVDALMAIRHRFTRATAVVTLTLQIAMTAAAMLSVCVDRPHTHGGRVAPDCAMHHQELQASENHHQHGHHADADHESRENITSIACRCSSDPLSFLVSDIGMVADRTAIRIPTSARSTITVFTSGTVDLHIPPLSPPPRPPLS